MSDEEDDTEEPTTDKPPTDEPTDEDSTCPPSPQPTENNITSMRKQFNVLDAMQAHLDTQRQQLSQDEAFPLLTTFNAIQLNICAGRRRLRKLQDPSLSDTLKLLTIDRYYIFNNNVLLIFCRIE